MSHPCNFCTLQWMQDRTIHNKQIVELIPKPEPSFPFAVNVYVRNVNDIPDYRNPDEENRQWRAWFAEISDHCVC